MWAVPGGVPVLYFDAKMLLTAKITEWIDITKDKFVVPRDSYGTENLWTGIMFSVQPKFKAWEKWVLKIMQNVGRWGLGVWRNGDWNMSFQNC